MQCENVKMRYCEKKEDTDNSQVSAYRVDKKSTKR